MKKQNLQEFVRKGLDMVRHGLEAAAYTKILDGDFRPPPLRRRHRVAAADLAVDVEEHSDEAEVAEAVGAGEAECPDGGRVEAAGDNADDEVDLHALLEEGEVGRGDEQAEEPDIFGEGRVLDIGDDAVVDAIGGGAIGGGADVVAIAGSDSPISHLGARMDADGAAVVAIGGGAIPRPRAAPRAAPRAGIGMGAEYPIFAEGNHFEEVFSTGMYCVFRLTRTKPGRGAASSDDVGLGGLQVACPYHKKNSKSGCRKTMTFYSPDDYEARNLF